MQCAFQNSCRRLHSNRKQSEDVRCVGRILDHTKMVASYSGAGRKSFSQGSFELHSTRRKECWKTIKRWTDRRKF
jgi:hypothetical protein